MDRDGFSALSRMLDVGAVPDDRSDDPRALPDVSPDVEKASFRRLLCKTGLLAAAPAEEEPPEEEFCSADAGVRPAGATRLDGATDNELPREALPASRDDCAADAGAVVLLCFGRPREFFCQRPLPDIDPLCPGAAVVAAVAAAGRCFYCWRSLVLTMVLLELCLRVSRMQSSHT